MLERVYEQAKKAGGVDEVIVATDDERIAAHARKIGAPVVMTRSDHPSGTDRCYEAYRLFNREFSHVINIQGDEPFLDPGQVTELAEACGKNPEIVTQMIRCHSHEVLFDTGEVKIVLNDKNEALYFSRNVIPYLKDKAPEDWHRLHTYYRHVGMYAYRTSILEEITRLPVSTLEKAESLEQLRWLQNGYRILCVETQHDSHCVDTPADIEKVLKLMKLQ
jgi:3-deoxy-manno-octulosonate cytidylyltransferase (CMP-KDO synthetase)